MKTGITHLTFKEAEHEFRFKKKLIPSVTDICNIVAPYRNWRGSQAAMRRGKNVHLLTRYIDEGTIEEANVPNSYRGYVLACLKFKQENPFIFTSIEKILFNLSVAGIPDRTGLDPQSVSCVLDYKTGAPNPKSDIVQVSGYRMLADAIRVYCVYLKENGSYKLMNYSSDLKRGTKLFLAGLEIWWWRND
jgi:hypothetical protein